MEVPKACGDLPARLRWVASRSLLPFGDFLLHVLLLLFALWPLLLSYVSYVQTIVCLETLTESLLS